MKKLFRETFWEFVQNLVLLAGFFSALEFWKQNQYILGIVCAICGGIIGALNIRFIELRFKGHNEPIGVTKTNCVIMPVLMIIFILYLSAQWSSWKTDLIIGIIAGTAQGIAQRITIRAPLDVVRTIAFACAYPLTIISMRTLSNVFPVILNILISTTVLTLVIILIDFVLSKKEPEHGS